MNILLVSTQDYIHHPVPSRHHYIFEELAKKHEVHVPHFHVSSGKERSTRLKVHEATLFPLKNPLLHYTLNAPYHYHTIRNIIRKERIDIVVAAQILAGTAAIRAAKESNIPVLFDLKDWFPDSAAAYYKNPLLKDIIRKVVWKITEYNLKKSDKITTVSPSLVNKLKYHGFDAGLITNGVDTDYFKPLDAKNERLKFGIEPETFVIGFVGSIERWYAIDNLIELLSRICNYHENTKLLIVGSSLFTDYQDELSVLVRNLGLEKKVLFTGTVNYYDLPQYISMMDICTIPLSPPQWVDIALPNKFFEYSACGKPILSRPIPDVMEIGGEHLYIYKNDEEFINIIRNHIRNPRKYSVNVDHFSWKEKAMEMEKHFQALITY
jgi:phosphatidylinositol alpha-1,6-mannosyltransferase